MVHCVYFLLGTFPFETLPSVVYDTYTFVMFNLLNPDIIIHILHTVLHKFPMTLMRIICLTIKIFLLGL